MKTLVISALFTAFSLGLPLPALSAQEEVTTIVPVPRYAELSKMIAKLEEQLRENEALYDQQASDILALEISQQKQLLEKLKAEQLSVPPTMQLKKAVEEPAAAPNPVYTDLIGRLEEKRSLYNQMAREQAANSSRDREVLMAGLEAEVKSLEQQLQKTPKTLYAQKANALYPKYVDESVFRALESDLNDYRALLLEEAKKPEVTERLNWLDQKVDRLVSQLSGMRPLSAQGETDDKKALYATKSDDAMEPSSPELSIEDQIARLKRDRQTLRASGFKDQHPDMVNLAKRIAKLEQTKEKEDT